MNIAVAIADEFEYIPFRDRARQIGCEEYKAHGRDHLSFTRNGHNVTAVQFGIGKVNAAAAAAFLIAEGKANVMLNVGLSGAVSELRIGDVIAPESFTECDFDLTGIGRPLGEKFNQESVFYADKSLLDIALTVEGVKTGKCGTGDLFLTDREKKKLYHSLFDIQSFDMETAALASVCHFESVPFLSVRKISDNADDAATDNYTEMNDRKEADLTQIIIQIIDML